MPLAERGEESGALTPALLLAGLLALAIALRMWQLGQWGFDGDEIYTLYDSLNLRPSNPRPLLYFLNHYLILPLAPLDELGLRILPAFFGVLAVPALYFITRRLVGTRAALFTALLVAVNPMHVHQSQYARYWSLVFLLSAIYPYAIYLGAREHNSRWLAFGVVTGVLAVLAHPVSVFLVGGLGLFLLLQLRRDVVARLWSQKTLRWIVLLSVVLALVAAVRSVDLLQGWISQHDASTRVPDHLRDGPRSPVVKQMAILLGFVDGVTLPVALIGALGLYLVWWQHSRPLGVFLACLLVVPVTIILLLSFRTAVGVNYLLPATPVLFIGAGVFLDRLANVDLGLRPGWLLPAAVTAIVIAPAVPSLISQYRDGRRYDLRGAAQWLQPRLTPGDVVFSVQSRITAHYMPGAEVQPLAPGSEPLIQAAGELRQSGGGEVLWIVAPAPSHAFRTNLKRGGLIRWMYDNCQLRNSLGVGRLDFRQQYLHIYRCPPADPGAAPDQALNQP